MFGEINLGSYPVMDIGYSILPPNYVYVFACSALIKYNTQKKSINNKFM